MFLQIGLACARALAVAGWNVVISGRRESNLQTAVQNISKAVLTASSFQSKTLYQVGDASKEDDVKTLFDFTEEQFGECVCACDEHAIRLGAVTH
jgi:NAD(P)-dependent dehydrogenase (short-subunit alcohol dehydrogenase family)